MSRGKSKEYTLRYGVQFPAYENAEERPPFATLADVDKAYPAELDPMGNPARLVECYLRYFLTGKLERVHPLGVADVVIKSGVTLEVKTGHGWVIEPNFETLEGLELYLAERMNPMMKASHVAYLSKRPTRGEDAMDCLFFTARDFLSVMGNYGKLVAKESRGRWGVAMKPWIAEGYAQPSSASKAQAIQSDLENSGMTIWEFAEKFGLELHE